MNHEQRPNIQQLKSMCESYLNQPVHVQVNGQEEYTGIVEQVDDHHVYLLVPVDEFGNIMPITEVMNPPSYDTRQYFNPYYYYPYYYPYPYLYPRPFRWNRLVLPLAALTALAAIF